MARRVGPGRLASRPSTFPGFAGDLCGKGSGHGHPDGGHQLCTLRADTRSHRAYLLAYPSDGVVYNGVRYPRVYWEGVVGRWQGDGEKARAAFTAARKEVAPLVAQQPDFAAALSLLGLIDAGLGQKEAAINEGRRACELVPMAKDAVDGVAYAANLGQIYTWTNEKDRAIDRLTNVESVPNFLSYGYLKLQPLWDPLRGDPRFEQLLASLSPKD